MKRFSALLMSMLFLCLSPEALAEQSIPDTNWFYSSIAQSAASIIGIFGAILATRLGSQIERAAKQQFTTTDALQKLEKDIRPRERKYTEYVKHSPSQISVLRAAIDSGQSLENRRWYSLDGVSDNACVGTDEGNYESEIAMTNVSNAAIPLLRRALSATDSQALKRLYDDLQDDLYKKSSRAGELHALGKLAKLAGDELDLLTLQTRSGLYFALLYTLLLLSLFGVVVPLSYLSAQFGIHKIVMTGFLAVALCILFAYIWHEISCLRRIGRYRSLLPPHPVLDGRTLG